MFARKMSLGLAGLVGCKLMGGVEVLANSKSETDMKDNLARRLAKSYVKSAEFKGGCEGVLMRCGRGEDVCAPSLVSIIAVSQEMCEVTAPDGTRVMLPKSAIYSTSLLKNLSYWYSTDPEMARTILAYIVKSNKGEIFL